MSGSDMFALAVNSGGGVNVRSSFSRSLMTACGLLVFQAAFLTTNHLILLVAVNLILATIGSAFNKILVILVIFAFF